MRILTASASFSSLAIRDAISASTLRQ